MMEIVTSAPSAKRATRCDTTSTWRGLAHGSSEGPSRPRRQATSDNWKRPERGRMRCQRTTVHLKQLRFSDLLDGRLEHFGVREHPVPDETTEHLRCLTDGRTAVTGTASNMSAWRKHSLDCFRHKT